MKYTSYIAFCLSFFVVAGVFSLGAWGEDPWADSVTAYSPVDPMSGFDDSAKAVGAPEGGGPQFPNNDAIVSLGGKDGTITLHFDTPVTDDAGNPFGLDCIVYSNSFWVGGNPQRKFQEPAIIEISDDGQNWYLVPGSRGFSYGNYEPSGGLYGNVVNPNSEDTDPGNDDVEYNWGYAEMTPTMQPYLDNLVRPDDPRAVGLTERSGGGDAFDIAWAIDLGGNPSPLTQFRYIRLTAFIDKSMGALGMVSPEIDAVADVAPFVDTDGDGIVDEYETRVANTDPLRPESTVLPLEIPPHEGGSPSGTLLGTVEADWGVTLRLYAADQRTTGGRNRNVTIDILKVTEPGGTLPEPELLKSDVVVEIKASEAGFVSAGIQPALISLRYDASEVTGLDETTLHPYRYQDGAYSQAGISEILANDTANIVSFKTERPGIFLLAATTGGGDSSTDGPKGNIQLSADPAGEVVANPANLVTVTSEVIMDASDGALITVAVSNGRIASPDEDAATSGTQITTKGGAISFDVEPGMKAGGILITATSVEGSAYGELEYSFVAGPPAPWVEVQMRKPEGATVELYNPRGSVRDQFGNVVRDGTQITAVVDSGDMLSGDADPNTPGHQLLVSNGQIDLAVKAINPEEKFVLSLYADAEMTVLIGRQSFVPADYTPMPMKVSAALILAVVLLATCLSSALFSQSERRLR